MAFDPCPHQIMQIVLKAGAIIRQLKQLPEEKNITVLYKETAPLLGIPVVSMNSKDVDHLPFPGEMKNEAGKFIVPRKDCPQCGKKDSMMLGPLCLTCEDAKGEDGAPGKYKSMYQCGEKDKDGKIVPETGCGHKEKLGKFITQVLNELGVDYRSGTKESMGIRTYTDDGLK